MSWGVSFGPTPVTQLKKSLAVSTVDDEEAREQKAAADAAVLALVKAGAAGGSGYVYVSVSGHASTGSDDPIPDHVTVNVTRADVVEAEA